MNIYTYKHSGVLALAAGALLAVLLSFTSYAYAHDDGTDHVHEEDSNAGAVMPEVKPTPTGSVNANTRPPQPLKPRVGTETPVGKKVDGQALQKALPITNNRPSTSTKPLINPLSNKTIEFGARLKEMQGNRLEKKEELKAKLTGEKRDAFAISAQNIFAAEQRRIAHLNENVAKIEKIIADFKAKGRDVNQAEIALITAKAAIAQAKKDIDEVSRVIKSNTASSTQVTKEMVFDVRDSLKVTRESIQTAHKAIQDIIPLLRTARGENAGGERPEPKKIPDTATTTAQ